MLSHTDLHDALGQVGDRTTVLWMRTRAHGNGQSSNIVVIAFSDFDQFVKCLAFFGCGTQDLIQRYATGQSTTIVDVGIDTGTDIIVSQHLFHLDAYAFRQLASHVRTHHVAGMVQNNQQDTGFTLHQLQSLKQTLCTGSGKHIAYDGAVQHTFAYESAQCWFMAGTAQRHDRHFVFTLRVGTYDDIFSP